MSLVKTKKEIAEVKAENARLKQAINLNIYSHVDIEQYNRRENIRIYGVPESSGKEDDGEQILFEIADELGIELDNWDIQRCHCLGKQPRNDSYANSNYGKTKSRPVIVRFVSCKKRTEFLYCKAELKKSTKFPNTCITEDLTQLRYKLLNYVKTKCNDRFVMCHSYNGKIRMKETDEEERKCIIVTSPDDLFNLNIKIDFAALNFQPLFINRQDLIVDPVKV